MRRMFVIITAVLLLFTGSVAVANVGWFNQLTDSNAPAHYTDKPSSPKTPRYNTECPTAGEIGKKVPVLMVHGWNGDPRTWGSQKNNSVMYGLLNSIHMVHPVVFDYQPFNQEWVTHPGIGSALSQKINCLTDASKAGGGKGRIIIIAHSMGGLATKRALALGGASSHIGLVITLGTPYKGSGFASNLDKPARSICRRVNPHSSSCVPNAFEGMSEHTPLIDALPKWPSNLGVMAIAGNVVIRAPVTDLLGDGVVSTPSAMAGGQRADLGGGTLVYRCPGTPSFPEVNAPCSHGRLPSYSPIQQQIKRSIQRYLASLRGPSVKIGDLRMWLKPGWKVNRKFSPGIRIEDTGSCYEFDGQRLCPYIIIFDNAKSPRGSETYCGRLKLAGFRKMGGKLSEFYRNTCHDGPANRALLDWFVPGKNIHIQSDNVPELSSWLEKNVAWE